jgi:hypothetical protein
MADYGYTADGVPIREGLRVFTNNLDRGVIHVTESHVRHWESMQKYRSEDLWFEVILDHDYKGNPTTGSTLQNGERVATRFDGKDA